MDGSDELVTALSSAARNMSEPRTGTKEETLALIVAGAVQAVSGAEHAGVALLRATVGFPAPCHAEPQVTAVLVGEHTAYSAAEHAISKHGSSS